MAKASVTRERRRKGSNGSSSPEGDEKVSPSDIRPEPPGLKSPGLKPAGLTFEPQFAERIWGGTTLERFGKLLPGGKKIGESWEISDVPGKPSRVTRGDWSQQTLRDLVRRQAAELLGDASQGPEHPDGGPQFPLLIKLLDAREDLSIQVHPSDADLLRTGLRLSGKTEAWIILDADPGARIIHGLAPGVRKEDVFERVRALHGSALPPADEERLFRWEGVRRGDVVFVPAGTIHAVGKGILLLEVQQTSDITYRIYDWGRLEKDGKPRDLHLSEAQGVSDAPHVRCPFQKIGPLAGQAGFQSLIDRSDCDKLQIEIGSLGSMAVGGKTLKTSTASKLGAGFQILSPFQGEIALKTASGEPITLGPGQFALVPAIAGEYEISASAPAQVLRFAGGKLR